MADDFGDFRVSLLRDALEIYRAEYGLLSERGRALETKAQGSVVIAGIFIAGIFAFIRELKPGSPGLERVLLAVVAVLLTASIGLAINALRVRQVNDPVPGEEAERMVLDIASFPRDEALDRIHGFYGEQFGVWRGVNEQFRKYLEQKAARLGLAHAGLMLAAIAMCVVSLFLIVTLR